MSDMKLGIRGGGCAVAALMLGCGAAWGASRSHAVPVNPWDEALRVRASFEAQTGKHSAAEYARVMDRFRTIYHDDPAAAHAGRAVEEVAELLAEQGHDLGDRKSLHDAARQYEFLAKAYPGPASSPRALGQALDLLGPGESDDAAEARQVRQVLLTEYPRSSAANAARESMAVARTGRPSSHLSRDEAAAKMGNPGSLSFSQC